MTDGPAAGWYPDPLGRFDHRYWDGASWTHHASRAGQATIDPLPGGDTVERSSSTDAGTPQDRPADPRPGFAAVGSAPADEPAWPTAATTEPGSPYRGDGGASGWLPPGPSRTTNVKAVVSLILSLVWLGGLASIAGIVLGVLARRDIERSGGREGGDGVAIAGIVIGVLGILATILGAVAIAGFVNAVESGDFGPVFDDAFHEGVDGGFSTAFGSGAAGDLEYTLLDVGFYQDLHHDETGVYADSVGSLEELGWLTADAVTVSVQSRGGEYWCVEARSDADPSLVWSTDRDDPDGPGPGTC